MPLSTKAYRIATGMIALSLLVGGPAAASAAASSVSGGTPVSAAGNSFFADVKAGHWAERSIMKLALQGIIVGDKGNFRPSASVSRQDAVIMALRFMGKNKDINEDQLAVFPDAFKVSEYAKPYVVLAFKLGLLNQEEEFKIAESQSKQDWGSTPASREWIAKLMIKAAGKNDLAVELASKGSSFQDAASISKGYAGYINAGVSLGLIKGVTPQKFEPLAAVNRASAAIMFSRAQLHAPVVYPGQTEGVLTAVNGSTLVLYTDDGVRSFNLAADARFYRFDSEAALKSSANLQLYTHVQVLGGGADALYVEQTDAEQQVKSTEGTVTLVSTANNKIWITDGNDMQAFDYDSNLVVKNQEGAKLSLADLKKDSQVIVQTGTFREEPIALEITVKSSPVNKESSGTVVSAAGGALVIKTASGADETWPAGTDVVVLGWDGRAIAEGVSGLKPGDAVSYVVKDSRIVSVKVTDTSVRSATGTFSAIAGDILTYVTNGKLQSSYLADNVTLVIPGVEQPVLTDLYKDDQLELALDAAGKVTNITVKNRSLSTLTGAEILNYSQDQKALTVKGTNGKLVALQLTDKTKVELNGTLVPVTSASSLLRQGQRVTVGYSGSDAVLIRFVYQYSGTVGLLNTATKTLALSLDDGSSVTLPFDSLSVEWFGKTGAVLADVKVGMKVTAALDSNQAKAVGLKVHQNVQYKISTVDAAGKMLGLLPAAGSGITIGAGSLSLKGDDGAAIPFSAFAAGQTVNVTYAGQSPAAIRQVLVRYGKITAVSADSVTYQEFGGSSRTVSLGSGYSIIKDGVTGSSSAVLAVGDRIEVRKSADGAVVIENNGGIKRNFWKMENGQLLTKRTSLSDSNYRFTLGEQPIVTAGGQTIALDSLKDGDSVTLYVFGGKLLEVVKG
ncbi:S-layer homology domain-containing protein [Paenibacillus pasadenensis]|uniref:S-layer homology domain-containing protein n=1 Tax=Paenibacillus pasadenensis TaxID=217090 RepID=UPI0020402391|nr:S-layer homology domain-containing protein [Paenibacillus pasadenensis]MCM3747551.1 S-layer homology domain-containing protein [Paenibacillus pasadenensis]